MKQRIRQAQITRFALAVIKTVKWFNYYLKYSDTLTRRYRAVQNRAKIMKEAHTIEKGLSFKEIRPYFGAAKRAHLLDEMHKSEATGDNSVPRAIGASVLQNYVAWHRESNLVNDDILDLEKTVEDLGATPEFGGTVPYRKDYTATETGAYDAMVKARRSLRNFRPEVVPLEVLKDAVRVANFSPSVCNRQSWAVAIVQDPARVKRMLDLQNGNRGFHEDIRNMIVVLADVRGFLDEYELFEPFVDAGIFSGALVNALNAHNVGSCCLNLCVSHHKVLEVAEALNLEPGLFPVMMIACGYAADDCRVAMSRRLEPAIYAS